MIEASASGDCIETLDDLGSGDAARFAYWEMQERIAEKRSAPGSSARAKSSNAIATNARRRSRPVALQYSLVERATLQPTLYSRTPTPDVERRFHDQDPVSRLAAMLIERCLAYAVDAFNFDAVMRGVVEDRLLPGRGVARVVYVPHFGDPKSDHQEPMAPDETPASDDDHENDASSAVPVPVSDLREVVFEEVQATVCLLGGLSRRTGPAMERSSVGALSCLYYARGADRPFGTEKGREVNLDHAPKSAGELLREDRPPDLYQKAMVHEVWDKAAKRVSGTRRARRT